MSDICFSEALKVAYTLYKLSQGALLFSCLEQFAIGKVIVCRALQEVVSATNLKFRPRIEFARGARMVESMYEF